MKDHPLAELFPLMDDADLAGLAADIKANGQRAPITLLDGKILDGRNRWRACRMARVEPKTKDFNGKDPLEFVLSANLHRRHLNESQRAMVAAKLAKMEKGKPLNAPIGAFTPPSQNQAAERLNVSRRSVQRAKEVLSDPIQSKAVSNGEKSVHAAVKEIRKAKEPKPEVIRDETGYAIPEAILPLWNRRDEVSEIQKAIARAKLMVKTAHEKPDILWQPVNMQAVEIVLNNAKRDLDLAMPYAVCCTCQGRAKESCTSCKGRGFISKHHFDVCVPEELKLIRQKSCVK